MAAVRHCLWVVALAALLGAGAVNAEVGANSRAAGMDRCVEPTALMRRNHMDLLTHQRDQTVHLGLRSGKHSLVECVACHAERDGNGGFLPINAEGQFCQGCHAAAAVDIDCFECHATRPDTGAGLATALTVAAAGPRCRPW